LFSKFVKKGLINLSREHMICVKTVICCR